MNRGFFPGPNGLLLPASVASISGVLATSTAPGSAFSGALQLAGSNVWGRPKLLGGSAPTNFSIQPARQACGRWALVPSGLAYSGDAGLSFNFTLGVTAGDGQALISAAQTITIKQTGSWNPSDKDATITLTNSNRTATKTSGGTAFVSVRSSYGRSSGKYYFELDCASTGSAADATFGIAKASLSTATYAGDGSAGQSFSIYQRDGSKLTAAASTAYSSGWTTLMTLGIAVDLDAFKMWFAKANVWQASGDPASGANPAFTGVSGTYFPIASHYEGSSTYSTTIKYLASQFTYSPPTGFSAWDPG